MIRSNTGKRDLSRKSTLLLQAGAYALLAMSIASPAMADGGIQTIEFNIEAQSLEDALQSYGVATDRQVLFATNIVDGKRAKAVIGELTPTQALDEILNGSGLIYETTASDVVLIRAEERGASIEADTSFQTAQLQDAPARRTDDRVEDVEAQDIEDDVMIADTIIVTGTNIRGIAPESSPSLSFDREDIDKSGFLTTDEFIKSIPQNFGGGANSTLPFGIPGDIESQANNILGTGVNIRGLGAGSTLTLLNGRRLSPAGRDGGFVDISSIPLSAVERIDVLTDGASSIYGGDAVAGVANFVLRDDYQGAETSLTYGGTTEGGREELRFNQLLGTAWSSGNGFVSYEFVDQGRLLAQEKDFSAGAPEPLTLLPSQERHSIVASLTQSLATNVEFGITGYYADRFSESIFNRPPEDLPVQFQDADTKQFLIAPSLTFDVNDNWRLVLAGDYSETEGEAIRADLDKATGVREAPTQTRNETSQTSIDLIADGTVFTVPAGEVKVAFGGAFREEDLQFFGTSGNVSSEADREVFAAFGEVFLPIVSENNAMALVQRLEVNASIRHDDYSDFGSSTNPKIGVLWSPVADLSLRGSYSTSFNPPDLGLLGNPDTGVFFIPTVNPETQAFDLQYLWLLGNDVTNIRAEESEAFTAGFDYSTEVFGGELNFSATYYDIEFDDQIGETPSPSNLDLFNVLASEDQLPPDAFIPNPTRAEVDFLIGLAEESGRGTQDFVPLFTGAPADLDNLDFIFDFQTRNLERTQTDGIDFNIDYSKDVGTGTLSLGLAGDYILDYTNRATSNSPEIDAFNRIFTPVDFRARGSLGWANDDFSISAFVNYTDGYSNDRVDPEEFVDDWTTIDLNVSYNFDGLKTSPILSDVRASLSIRNLFDEDPPFVDASDNFSVSFFDGANANPLGRFVSVSVVKAW